MPQQHNPGRHVQSLTLPQSRHNHRNTSAYIFPTVPTPRTTPPTPGTASPRRRAPTLQLPVATRPLHSRHSPAAAQRFHRSDASEHPADTGPRLAAGPQRSNSPSQRSRAIQDTPLPPNTDPTSSRHLGPQPTPGHASPPGPNAPTPRRNAPAPFKAHTCRRTPVPTAPTPRTTPPTPGHASPPGPNAPTPRRNAPAPFKTHPCRRTTAPHRPNPRTTPPAQDSTAPPGTKKSGSASRTYSFVSNFSVKNRRLHLAQTNALTQHNQSGAYPLINPCPHN